MCHLTGALYILDSFHQNIYAVCDLAMEVLASRVMLTIVRVCACVSLVFV